MEGVPQAVGALAARWMVANRTSATQAIHRSGIDRVYDDVIHFILCETSFCDNRWGKLYIQGHRQVYYEERRKRGGHASVEELAIPLYLPKVPDKIEDQKKTRSITKLARDVGERELRNIAHERETGLLQCGSSCSSGLPTTIDGQPQKGDGGNDRYGKKLITLAFSMYRPVTEERTLQLSLFIQYWCSSLFNMLTMFSFTSSTLTMLLLLLSALTLLLASEDLVCHPFLSEFPTLRSRTTADLQYVELTVTKIAKALCKL
ncbi:hypothetical protein RB195_014285 [Necator americanus]|uniref:Uncharacterized protein n=1 Tax=Necator americanus TaxID=51031 RepID=A0ABR1DZM1_NECAM